MTNIYSVNLVNVNSNEDVTKKVSIECLEIFNELFKSLNYVNNLKELEIQGEKYNVMKFQNIEPNHKDVDGLYFVYDKNIHKFNMYLKKTNENHGYLYSYVDIKIEYIGFIEIIKSSISFNLNEKTENELIKLNNIIKKKKIDENKMMISNLNKQLLEELKNKLDNLNIKKNN